MPCNLYTPQEDKIFHQHYPTSPRNTIEKLLPRRTWKSIQSRAERLGIKRHRLNDWSKEELEKLKKLYPTEPRKEILKQIKRSWRGILNKAYYLGLRRIISDPIRQKLNMEKNQYMRIKEMNKFEEVKIY